MRSSFFRIALALALSLSCVPRGVLAQTASPLDTPDWTSSLRQPPTTAGGYDVVESADTHELVVAIWKIAPSTSTRAMRLIADGLVREFGPDVAGYRGAAMVVRFFGSVADANHNVKTASFAYVPVAGSWQRASSRKRIAQLIIMGL